MPFELDASLFAIGPLVITNLELLLAGYLVCGTYLWALGRWAGSPIFPRTWSVLLGLFVVMAFLAALLAPALRANAFQAALRTLAGLALAVTIPHVLRTTIELLRTSSGLVIGGLIASMLGLVELYAGVPLAILDHFRTRVSTIGPFIRLTGTFDYSNQASMFIEAALPLLVGMAWLAWKRGHKRRTALAFGGVLIFVQALVLTYSRAGLLLTVAAALASAGLSCQRRLAPRERIALAWAGLTLITVIIFGINAVENTVIQLRLSGLSEKEWYRFELQAPDEIVLGTGATGQVPIDMSNLGVFVWSEYEEKPVWLGARWHPIAHVADPIGEASWPLTSAVAPGETTSQTVAVQAPLQPGLYWLEWDMYQAGVTLDEPTRFSRVTGRQLSTLAVIIPKDQSSLDLDIGALREESDQFHMPFVSYIPDRLTLWSIAFDQLLKNPLSGIGLDNFRLIYGQALGWDDFDTSIHSNNWYLETALSLGLIGSMPFFLWSGLVIVDLMKTLRRQTVAPLQAAVAVGLLAYFGHGLVDYFLLFHATGLLFWMMIGFWVFLKNTQT